MSLAHRVEKLKRFLYRIQFAEIHSIIVEIGDTKGIGIDQIQEK